MSGAERQLTTKGARQAEAILEAAIRCLGRDGYAATSLQTVAQEAGTQKRMVVYYFGSRQQLMSAVVDRLADRFLARVEAAIAEVTSPAHLVDVSIDLLLAQQTEEDRAAQVAYFGLVAESVTDPAMAESLLALNARAREFLHEVLDDFEEAGYRLTMDRDLLLMAVTAAAHGFGLELLLRGRTRELTVATALAQAGLPTLLFETD